MKMSNKLYDVLKWIAIVFIPACATLYSVLSVIWGLPYGVAITGTLSGVEVFLGTLLGISSAKYKKDNDNKGE